MYSLERIGQSPMQHDSTAISHATRLHSHTHFENRSISHATWLHSHTHFGLISPFTFIVVVKIACNVFIWLDLLALVYSNLKSCSISLKVHNHYINSHLWIFKYWTCSRWFFKDLNTLWAFTKKKLKKSYTS